MEVTKANHMDARADSQRFDIRVQAVQKITPNSVGLRLIEPVTQPLGLYAQIREFGSVSPDFLFYPLSGGFPILEFILSAGYGRPTFYEQFFMPGGGIGFCRLLGQIIQNGFHNL